jgi:uracil-DNA glycosylase family 4
MNGLDALQKKVIRCRQCPRLVDWREQVAREKRASFKDDEYWGKALPGFGDPDPRLLIIGLAPAAHGANRTGRMFTGDRSGEWLYRALHRAGFANQAISTHRDDGLELVQTWVTAMVRCAPPANKPTTEERDACRPFVMEEFRLMPNVCVVLALGSFAWNGALGILAEMGHSLRPKPRFTHLAEVRLGPYTLLGSYHPSQQNTFTGTLTEPMFDAVFSRAKQLIKTGRSS